MTSSEQRDALRELAPLYVNGALSGPVRARFELRLKHDAGLRLEVDELAEIELAFRQAEARIAIDLDAVFETVRVRIREGSTARRSRYRDAIPELITSCKRLLQVPAAGWATAAALLVVLTVMTAPALRHTTGVSQTFSDGARQQKAGQRIHVVFTDQATQQQVRSLLENIGARISDGPNEVGAMTLELQRERSDASEAVAALRASEIVVFAEVAY